MVVEVYFTQLCGLVPRQTIQDMPRDSPTWNSDVCSKFFRKLHVHWL
jgi:hypothetical protein